MVDLSQVHEGLREIDVALHNLWTLGKNVIVGWRTDEEGIQVCFAPCYRVLGEAVASPWLLDGRRMMDAAAFKKACKILQARPLHLPLPFRIGSGGAKGGEVDPEAVDTVVRRYSIVRTAHRVVMLFDIVDFAKASPVEQLAQFISLESSISAAGAMMTEAGLPVELARSTAGDGFIFVWNRFQGFEADQRAYAAFLLTLLDNAMERRKGGAGGIPVPHLRACLTVGSHYSYHQVENNRPRTFEYATGQVTITLARLTEKALPGQILLGSFQRPTETDGAVDSVLFLARAEKLLTKLTGTKIAEEYPINEIRAVLSGGAAAQGGHHVAIYTLADKHGNAYEAFNLRLKATLDGADAIDLGLRPDALKSFRATSAPYEISIGAPVPAKPA